MKDWIIYVVEDGLHDVAAWKLKHSKCGWESNLQYGTRSVEDILRWIINHGESCPMEIRQWTQLRYGGS